MDDERHGWTHPICPTCYETLQLGRQPARLKNPDAEACCWCGVFTLAGIYYRADPSVLPCFEVD